jgi:hypothetical protein
MRHSVSIVLGALSGAFVITATPPLGPPALHAQTNWREVRSLKMGRFRVRVDVSPARTVRLYSQLDTSRLTSPELPADTVKAWQTMVFSELDKPTRREYMLGNAILVQPFAADSASIGYVLTVADTSGKSRQVVTDIDGMEEFLDLLAKGATSHGQARGSERIGCRAVRRRYSGARETRVHHVHASDVQGFRRRGNGGGENDGVHPGDDRGTQDRAARSVSDRLQVERGAARETVRDTHAKR